MLSFSLEYKAMPLNYITLSYGSYSEKHIKIVKLHAVK